MVPEIMEHPVLGMGQISVYLKSKAFHGAGLNVENCRALAIMVPEIMEYPLLGMGSNGISGFRHGPCISVPMIDSVQGARLNVENPTALALFVPEIMGFTILGMGPISVCLNLSNQAINKPKKRALSLIC